MIDKEKEQVIRISHDALFEETNNDPLWDYKNTLKRILHLLAPDKYDEDGDLI